MTSSVLCTWPCCLSAVGNRRQGDRPVANRIDSFVLQRVSRAKLRLPIRRVQRHLAVTTRIILEKPAGRKRWKPGVKSYQTLTLFIPGSNQTGVYCKQCGLWVGERVSLPHYYLFPEGALILPGTGRALVSCAVEPQKASHAPTYPFLLARFDRSRLLLVLWSLRGDWRRNHAPDSGSKRLVQGRPLAYRLSQANQPGRE